VNWVVVDTSYLVELYRVPGMFSEEAHVAVVGKFQGHVAANGRLYVPVPVIFELANHIADIRDGTIRHRLAAQLRSAVETSLDRQSPWIIVPMEARNILWDLTDALLDLCGAFAGEYAVQGIGLTDAAIIDFCKILVEARRDRLPVPLVHIWTRDVALKAREPDREEQSFV